MVTFIELASLIGGRWRFHSLETSHALIGSPASTHWKECKQALENSKTSPEQRIKNLVHAPPKAEALMNTIILLTKIHRHDSEKSAVGLYCFLTNLRNA